MAEIGPEHIVHGMADLREDLREVRRRSEEQLGRVLERLQSIDERTAGTARLLDQHLQPVSELAEAKTAESALEVERGRAEITIESERARAKIAVWQAVTDTIRAVADTLREIGKSPSGVIIAVGVFLLIVRIAWGGSIDDALSALVHFTPTPGR